MCFGALWGIFGDVLAIAQRGGKVAIAIHNVYYQRRFAPGARWELGNAYTDVYNTNFINHAWC